MTVAYLTLSRLQDADDFGSTPGAGNDGYALTWDNGAGEFVLAAAGVTDHGALTGLSDDDHSQYLLATGARTGASSQAQTFTNGIIGPSWKPASDSAAALQLQTSAGMDVVTLDTTNKITYITGAVSTAPLGSELLTNGAFASNDFTGWTAGANWSAATGAAVHTAGSVEAITQNVSVINGTIYQLVFTTTGRTAGSITITLGAVTLDIGSGITGITTNSTQVVSITAGATGSVAFTVTPTSDWNGSIDNISLKAIGVAQEALSLKDDTGSEFVQFRGKASAYNTAIGHQALQFNTTGINNTAMGHQALQFNTTGTYNTAIGYLALRSNTTGTGNTATGRLALFSNTTGANNTATGRLALHSNTTGTYNTVMGSQALYYNTTGTNNTAMGYQALHFNTTGANNTAMGYQALYSNATGANNTAMGYQAGRYHANGSTELTDPENSVYIGYGARGYDNSDSNSIVIGYDAAGLGANTTVIGNTSTTAATIYGAGRFLLTNATTNAVDIIGTLGHNTSGTAAAGFGGGLAFNLQSSTTASQSAAQIAASWIVATHASRTARLALSAYDYNGAREGVRIDTNGSAALLGFYGHAATAQQVLATGAGASVDNVISALQALGLVKQA